MTTHSSDTIIVSVLKETIVRMRKEMSWFDIARSSALAADIDVLQGLLQRIKDGAVVIQDKDADKLQSHNFTYAKCASYILPTWALRTFDAMEQTMPGMLDQLPRDDGFHIEVPNTFSISKDCVSGIVSVFIKPDFKRIEFATEEVAVAFIKARLDNLASQVNTDDDQV